MISLKIYKELSVHLKKNVAYLYIVYSKLINAIKIYALPAPYSLPLIIYIYDWQVQSTILYLSRSCKHINIHICSYYLTHIYLFSCFTFTAINIGSDFLFRKPKFSEINSVHLMKV